MYSDRQGEYMCHYFVKNEIRRKYISVTLNIFNIGACICINFDKKNDQGSIYWTEYYYRT